MVADSSMEGAAMTANTHKLFTFKVKPMLFEMYFVAGEEDGRMKGIAFTLKVSCHCFWSEGKW